MRVVLAEDNALLRAGLVELLTQAGLEVAGQAQDAEELIDLVREELPDVVVVDIRMPPTHTVEGLVAARALRAEHGTAIGILVLSHHVETRYALELLEDGADGVGYLLKDRVLDPADLVDAILRVGQGGTAVDPVVIQHLLRRRRDDGQLGTLTARERDVLAEMAEGRSNQAIAARLHLSEKTVEAYSGRIFGKLDLQPSSSDHRRVRAVLAYLQGTKG